MRQLADRDHEQENAADREHREDDLFALLGGRLGSEERMEDGAEHGEKLPHAPHGVRGERGVDGLVSCRRTRGRFERRRI